MTVFIFKLEYDTERAGTFEPLKYLPPNKSVVLGIVSSKLSKVFPSFWERPTLNVKHVDGKRV
jgi:hypothetical protein